MPRKSSLVRLLGFVILVVMSIRASSAANTPGRAWTPVQIRQSVLGPTIRPRLEIESDGAPIMFGATDAGDVGDRGPLSTSAYYEIPQSD